MKILRQPEKDKIFSKVNDKANFLKGEWFSIILIEEFFVDEVKSKSFSSSVHPGDQVWQLLACFHLKLIGYIEIGIID